MVEGQELSVCLLLVRLGESFLNWGLMCPESPFYLRPATFLSLSHRERSCLCLSCPVAFVTFNKESCST